MNVNPQTGQGTLVLGDERRVYGHRRSAQWWLLDESGDAVAFVEVMSRDQPGTEFEPNLVVCDIEVREDARGRGWARAIIAATEAHYGFSMSTSGSYTPLGFAALAAHLPVAYGNIAGVRCDPMTFIANWQAREPKYPLRGAHLS